MAVNSYSTGQSPAFAGGNPSFNSYAGNNSGFVGGGTTPPATYPGTASGKLPSNPYDPSQLGQYFGGGIATGGAGSSVSFGPNGVTTNLTKDTIPESTAAQEALAAQAGGIQSSLGAEQASYQQQLAAQQAAAEQALQTGSFTGQGQLMTQKAGLLGQLFNQRVQALNGLMGPLLSGTTSAGGVSNVLPGVSGQSLFDLERQAGDAAYAHARDIVGSQGASAVDAIRQLAANNGTSGSTGEMSAIAPVIQGAGQNLTGYEDAITQARLGRYGQIADLLAQLGVQERGQNISALTGLYGAIGSGLGSL